jgi:hypothetical protein
MLAELDLVGMNLDCRAHGQLGARAPRSGGRAGCPVGRERRNRKPVHRPRLGFG